MSEEIQRQFVEDCMEAGYYPRTYSGRFYYHGFGVVTNDPESVRTACRCSLNSDSMGMDVILYPTQGVSREEMDQLAEELHIVDEDDWDEEDEDEDEDE